MIGTATRRVPEHIPQVVTRFDSALELAKLADKRKLPFHSSTQEGKAFNGTDSFEEAMDLARDGWSEGRSHIEALTGSLVSSVAGRIVRQDWIPDVEGNYVDLGLYVAREPEYWIRPEETFSEFGTSRRHIRILYNGTVSGGVSQEVIEARGAAIVALADLLEIAGDVVTVDVVYANNTVTRESTVYVNYVNVKAANERCDLDKMMFWLAHPAALRRIMFGYFEGYPGCSPSYGRPWDPRFEAGEEPDVYMQCGYVSQAQWENKASAQKWISKTLEELGVQLTV